MRVSVPTAAGAFGDGGELAAVVVRLRGRPRRFAVGVGRAAESLTGR